MVSCWSSATKKVKTNGESVCLLDFSVPSVPCKYFEFAYRDDTYIPSTPSTI